MNKTWMPIAAGILDVISGAFQLGVSIYILSYTVPGVLSGRIHGDSLAFVPIALGIGTIHAITGIVAILGGVCLLKKGKKNLIYLGALAASLPLVLLLAIHPAYGLILPIGIGALILSLRAEKKFKQNNRHSGNVVTL